MRRRRKIPIPIVAGGITIIIILLYWRMLPLFFSPSALEVVEEFYTYEQKGDFSSSWQLFHPIMRERFNENDYVAERSHIYMSHYGVSTFSFEILDHKKIKIWKTANKTFKNVEKINVEQTFKSKFGVITIKQSVYAVKEEDDWKLLWEF